MWLLKLHLATSILYLITFIGFSRVYGEQIKENGWGKRNKGMISFYLIFLVPILRFLILIMLFVMIGMTKDEFYKIGEEHKKNRESEEE